MGFAFPWPYSQGEWLAWGVAAVTTLLGLLFLFAPRLSLRLLRLQTTQAHPKALSAVRGPLAGFHLGLGLCSILFAQPFLYVALGVAWALDAFGRAISIMSDDGNTLYGWTLLVFALVMAILPLAFAIGLIG